MKPHIMVALYAPADRPERFAKALDAGADAVIFDLEDAVTAGRKDVARRCLQDAKELWEARGVHAPAVQVRINGRGSSAHHADLEAVAALPEDFGVRVPKIESAEDVTSIRAAVPNRHIHALLESALSVERAFEIASAGVASIATGEADLRADLGVPAGVDGEPGLQFSRSRIVNAAAAAGLVAPLMAVFADIADLGALEASCVRGRSLGFAGRSVLHPRQIAVVRKVFTPDSGAVARAHQIIDRVRSGAQDGTGAFTLDDGTFLDVAMVRAAERTIAASIRYREESP